MHYVYILYSKSLNKYYVGETVDVDQRLEMHNSGCIKGAFTKKANDWEVKLILECKNVTHGLRVEKAIKKRKSRNYIENLIQYEELRIKLVSMNE